MALLEIRNVTHRFGKLEAVKDVTLAIEAGELFTLLGPSGCGKTTILRKIAGFDAPGEGEVSATDVRTIQPGERGAFALRPELILRDFDPGMRRALSRMWTEIKVH